MNLPLRKWTFEVCEAVVPPATGWLRAVHVVPSGLVAQRITVSLPEAATATNRLAPYATPVKPATCGSKRPLPALPSVALRLLVSTTVNVGVWARAATGNTSASASAAKR